MKKFIAYLSVLVFCMDVYSQTYSIKGKVEDMNGVPVIGANVQFRQVNQTKSAVSNNQGIFALTNVSPLTGRLTITFIGMESYSKELLVDKDMDLGAIVLKEDAKSLNEVVITAKTVETFADKTVFRLKPIDRDTYNSALKALDVIPKIQVLDHDVSLVNGKSVKLLINGIASEANDLSVIPPSDILRIEYYDNPPARFANLGLGAVVNVITKKRDKGGQVGVNLQNAVTTGFGNDVVNFGYNWGSSRIGVKYNINYRNYDKRLLDEVLEYKVGETTYYKEKVGENSPYRYEEQLAEVNFSNQKVDNYIIDAKFSVKSLNRRRSSFQNIYSRIDNTPKVDMTGLSSDKDKYIRPAVDIYINKLFGSNKELVANVVGTYYHSTYNYRYKESADNLDNFVTSTLTDADKYSVIGDFLYAYKMKKQKISVGMRYTYGTSLQKNTAASSQSLTDKNNELYAYAELNGIVGEKFTYAISAGANYNSFNSDIIGKRYNRVFFRPSVSGNYSINKESGLVINYQVNSIAPSLSELSNNFYYKDEGYVYGGNPDLVPYNQHEFSLSYNYGTKRFMFMGEADWMFANNPIRPVFQNHTEYVMQTVGNIDKVKVYKGAAFFQWYPFAGNWLRLRLYSEVFHTVNKNQDETWRHTGYRIIPSMNLVYGNWGMQLLYQSKAKQLSGQILTTSPSMAMLELSYRPLEEMVLTAGIRYPFYDAWETSSEVKASKFIRRLESERIKNNANMVYIGFVYNFSFGNMKSMTKKKVNNEDKDSGILNRL